MTNSKNRKPAVQAPAVSQMGVRNGRRWSFTRLLFIAAHDSNEHNGA
jgi:hypothetical protein